MVEAVAAGTPWMLSRRLPPSDRTSWASVEELLSASSPSPESSSVSPLLLSHPQIPRLELDSLISSACSTIHERCGFLRSLQLSGLSSVSNDLGLTMPPVRARMRVPQGWV